MLLLTEFCETWKHVVFSEEFYSFLEKGGMKQNSDFCFITKKDLYTT